MDEVRARVIIQQKGLYTISFEGEERLAEVSGKFRYEAKDITDFPAVGDYVLSTWPDDGSHCIINLRMLFARLFGGKKASPPPSRQRIRDSFGRLQCCVE